MYLEARCEILDSEESRIKIMGLVKNVSLYKLKNFYWKAKNCILKYVEKIMNMHV